MALIYGANTLVAQPFLPHGEVSIFGATVSEPTGSACLVLLSSLTVGATLILLTYSLRPRYHGNR